MSTETALITGGAGFIGCAVASRLVAEGRDVHVVDSLHPQVHKQHGRPPRLPEEANLLPFDVTDATAWDALLRLIEPDVVVHLAAETGTGQSLREASRHGSVNVVGTTEMLDAFARHEKVPSHLVLASSRAVYGEGEWEADGVRYHPNGRSHQQLEAGRWDPHSPHGAVGRPLPSSAGITPPDPTNVYAATKLAQEHICRAWGTAMGSAVSVLRLQNVYGIGQSLDNPYTGIVSLFARRAASGETIDVFEDGEIIREFVYVDDAVSAVMAAVGRLPVDPLTVDIGSGASTTVLELARTVSELSGGKEPVITGQFRDGDVRAAYCDGRAASDALGYTPQWDLRNGLTELLGWVRRELETG
jgi:dTDP-L-rhamnose 4-epimerase